VFDDLLKFTTPAGQRLAVETINPGVAAHNGVVQFQLREGGRIAIESARWPFAGGVLAVAPTTITLGAEETRFALTLADIDVATLLAELNVPDLVATGTVGGEFPLVLTEHSARIENGQLAASSEGGTITYAGAALQNATGVARLAFGALASFRYDNLTLELNGDLAGDLVTAINFRGANRANLDLGGGAGPLSGGVAGMPFVFNVRVVAPFRRLGDMAATAFNPQRAIEQAGQALSNETRANGAAAPAPGETSRAPAPVDPPAPANE
jgi:translocation and assembly module TamB